MNMKITSTALAALMIAGTTSFSAFAAMKTGTVVIGTKAYDINYLNDSKNLVEISAQINAGGTIYVKNFNGDWVDNVSGAKVLASVIPAVTYKDATGTSQFAAADQDAVLTATVTSVSATNTNTLLLAGTGLGALKTTDLSLTGNTITSVTPSADGTSATVVLGTLITPNVESTLMVNATSFNFTYKLVADTAAITAATYDDSRANQYVGFTVNGATANVANLLANGYTVKFTATDSDATADKSVELFSNQTTGLLNTAGLLADTSYKVQVTLTNGTNVIVAPIQTIKISNLDLAATAINSYELLNTTGGASIVQNSTKLVAGDTAIIQNLKVLIDGTEEKVLAPTKIESSNKAVASVVTATGVITANTPGTTTLTITYGNVTKTVALTVVNEGRDFTSLKVTKVASTTQIYNTTAIKSLTPTALTVSPIDQYGDPINGEAITIESTDTAIATAPGVTSDVTGKKDIAITALKAGSTTLLFKNSDNKTISTFGVNVTEDNGVATKKLEIVAPLDADSYKKSADNTVDLSDDKLVEYKLNQYTSQGIKNGAVDLTNYKATSSDKSVADIFADKDSTTPLAITDNLSGTTLTIKGLKKGIATISLKDVNGVNVGTITVTVVDNGAVITGVAFKPQTTTLNYAKKVDYTTFLSYTEPASGIDPIISGITLSKSTTNSTRLEENSGTIYIDQNGDGLLNKVNTTDDKVLGQIVLGATSDSTNLTPIVANSITLTSGTVAKGTLIFKVMSLKADGTTLDKILASTSLDVDVK